MGLKLINNIGLDKLVKKLSSKDPGMQRAVEVGLQEAITTITLKARRGMGLNRRLKPYSKSYIEAIKKGRAKSGNIRKRSTSPVNLTVSGQMLNSLTTKVTQRGRTVVGEIFSGDANNAAKLEANNRLRKFFGINDSMARAFEKRIDDYLKGIL